ncbi:MAG: HlyD family efflux transporter periplasmic adaptor subunit [Rubrivivax sp.]|nr:HlyD family efflux transporter periplasmic adaptor subunit [Rubrivivax sp.]
MTNEKIPPESRRRAALLGVAVLVLAAAAVAAAWWALVARHHESTDNAYVQAPVVQVTPQVGGTVVAVLADDTDRVQAGQPLVKLDAADARLALERAEAQLAQTVREVRGLYAGNATQDATIRLREAELRRAEADVQRAEEDVARRRPLLATGAVGAEEFQHAQATLASAQSAAAAARSALAAAREQAGGQRALTDGTVLERHPSVERAAAAVREAWLALARCELPAPVAGQVARRTVQVGQRVAAGAPLMAVVPLEQAWVEANFKEGQLRSMRVGQPVVLTADLYGGKVEYRGRVLGLGAGTGAAFSLLPAQNATGNWIKVVQRVPVRIELDAQQLAAHPLRVGLSMEAVVDTRDASGAPVAANAAARAPRASTTAVFDGERERADRRVDEIVRANRVSGAAQQVARSPRSGSGAVPAPLVSASR